jgi:hypothetical protein
MVTPPSILLIEDSPGECELSRLALAQIGLDITLYTEQEAEATLHFLNDRYHQSSIQARSHPLREGGLNLSPTACTIPPVQPSADFSPTQPPAVWQPFTRDALFPEGAHSYRAASTSTGDQSGIPSLILQARTIHDGSSRNRTVAM